jgi:hypothetical protein
MSQSKSQQNPEEIFVMMVCYGGGVQKHLLGLEYDRDSPIKDYGLKN